MAVSITRLHQLKELQKALNYTFRDIHLLDLALTHISYSKELRIAHPDNERLEFLGDAVLKLVISTYLYENFPHEHEGFLTKIRAHVISDQTLAGASLDMHLGEHIALGKNEALSGGAKRPSIVGNALEALFGACYLDGGYESAKTLILQAMQPAIADALSGKSTRDFKSQLQEHLQGLGWNLPEYHVIQEAGPEHAKVFTIEAKAGKGLKRFKEKAQGHTKKEAEQKAAEKLLETLLKG